MSYAIAKATAMLLNADYSAACKVLKQIPSIGSGPMGLTPDDVKNTPEYRIAKQAMDKAFAELRSFNAVYSKRFKKEIATGRKAKREKVVA